MATKTFKIGLSNTDKQNMAQDVYERLLALTFPEYDTTEDYSVGDFVVYNDQLYKCISATSGAWDSTKWQLATLNDLLTDIESAVAFVNDKANVDGNYPTMTVGVADQLSPYDDESGDDQDEPFSFQATGTGNGSQPDFSTGSIALMKEKQGNTVCVNQLLANGDFESTTGWSTYSSNFSILDGIASFTATGQYGNISKNAIKRFIDGHKYIIQIYVAEVFTNTVYITLGDSRRTGDNRSKQLPKTVGYHYLLLNGYQSNPEGYSNGTVVVANHSASDFETIKISHIKVIDLTQWFNGDIPQDLLYNPSNFYRYYQGSLAYNTGELVNANGRYIKCIGRNQWDEEWELGGIDSSTGQNSSSSSQIRSKNYIQAIPNTDYYAKIANFGGNYIGIYCYDKDKNFIKVENPNTTTHIFTTPANCCYIRFICAVAYGTTYNHDITISLYYEDESGYDQYYPYQVLTNNDTGTEVLRSAGSVKDIKLPSGEIKRNVGYVDLGGLEWTWQGPSEGFKTTLALAKQSNAIKVLIGNGFTLAPNYSVYSSAATDKAIFKTGNNSDFYIKDNSWSSSTDLSSVLDGVILNYELDTHTTEQGTPFSENLVIDDFGSMDFQGTNGVPQGNLIFYPVDYKAFIDTLYNYTEGTPSELALKSDLSADKSELQGVDTQLQNAIGGTLRQCLCVKESLDFENTDFVDLGTLSWIYNSTSGHERMVASLSQWKKPATSTAIPNGLTTKLKVVSVDDVYNHIQQGITHESDSNAVFVYTSDMGTDATAFKNAMKGVLLAYEKASS